MGGAIVRKRQTGTDARQNDRKFHAAYVDLQLLKATEGNKRGDTKYNHLFPARCETRGDVDHVLLRHPDVDKPAGIFRSELAQTKYVHFVRYDDDLPITPSCFTDL